MSAVFQHKITCLLPVFIYLEVCRHYAAFGATALTVTALLRSVGIGVARGCSRCTCTPQGGDKKFFRPNLQEKCVSAPLQYSKCTPQPEQESIFRSFCWVA